MFIGKRIKELRKSQKVSLTELAQKSGVQIATLSRIENEKMVGSLESHMNIAKALNIDITHLYSDITPMESRVDLKADQAKSEIFEHNPKASYEILIGKVLSKKMMPTLIRIEPGGRTNTEQNQPGAEKFIFVLEGQVKVYIKEESYALAKNNSLYFDASLPHYLVNEGSNLAKAICVGTPVAL